MPLKELTPTMPMARLRNTPIYIYSYVVRRGDYKVREAQGRQTMVSQLSRIDHAKYSGLDPTGNGRKFICFKELHLLSSYGVQPIYPPSS